MSCGVAFVGIEHRDGNLEAHLTVEGQDVFVRTPDELADIQVTAREACAALVTARAREFQLAAKRANEHSFSA